MDPISQAALGALAGMSVGGEERRRVAALVGGLGGLLPDADVLIRSSTDPLLALEYHRHFTHSLAFIPVGAAIAAGLGLVLTRGRHRFGALYLPALLGYATHGLLDGCTSYGTFLLWPFSDVRVAWRIISVVDPLFTAPLLLTVVLALRWRRAVLVGWAWVALVLSLGLVQQHRAAEAGRGLIAERGHAAVRAEVKPGFANSLLWRAYYEADGRYYVDAVRLPWVGAPRIYEGGSIDALDIDAVLAQHAGSEATLHDLRRFSEFSQGWLVVDPDHPDVISDVRYAMLPNAVRPLWGVDLGEQTEAGHHPFVRFSDMTPAMREAYWGMLRGE